MYYSTVISNLKSFPKEIENSLHKPRSFEHQKKKVEFIQETHIGVDPFLAENSKLTSSSRVDGNMKEQKERDQE